MRLTAFSMLAVVALAACEPVPSGSTTSLGEPSLEASVTQFAFNEAGTTAAQTGVRKFPIGNNHPIRTILVDPRTPRSFEQAESQNLGMVVPCRTGESCDFDFGGLPYKCFSDSTSYYCETRRGSSNIRLTFAGDGRFAQVGDGEFAAGVWHDTSGMRQAVLPTYTEMSRTASRVYSVRAPVEAKARSQEAARVRAENRRRFEQTIAVLTGVAAGLSGQPVSNANQPNSSGKDDSCELGIPGRIRSHCQ